MKVLLVPPSIAADSGVPAPYLTSYIIDNSIAIDAGCLGFYATPHDQQCIEHLFLSHTHLDHVASLPIFLENIYDPSRNPVTIWASEPVLDSLRRDLFNERVWPDFFALSEKHPPFFQARTLRSYEPVTIGNLRVTAVPVNHVVPTAGFIVEDANSAIVIVSDTAATEEIWERANRVTNLKAVFLEASFPNSMGRLAEIARHMTPAMFGAEVRKLKRQAPIIAVHIKARYYQDICKELDALALPQLTLARYGEEYRF